VRREWRPVDEFQEFPWSEFLWRGGYPALWSELEASPPELDGKSTAVPGWTTWDLTVS
jgi:hypothetical protein